ncbi:MAG: dephospho-CoA kinase [Alphaproteobacteria bacterium]
MIVIGVTGGIASGKSTIATIFAAAGIPVFDADRVIHETYAAPSAELARAFPAAVSGGVVDRDRLSATLEADPDLLTTLEAITHPIVRARAEAFLEDSWKAGQKIVALDVPLLFETGLDLLCDHTLVAIAPVQIRRGRVGERGSMSEGLFRRLVERQMPDRDKIEKADYVVDTEAPIGDVERVIRTIIDDLTVPNYGS